MQAQSAVIAACFAASFVANDFQVVEARTWTNRSGETIEAKFIDFQGEQILLFRADGKAFAMAPSQLSDSDQEFVRELSRFRRDTEPPDLLRTKGGSSYVGKIEDDGRNYVVHMPSGSKRPIPKDVATEVYRGADLLGGLRRSLCTSDLLDNTTVARLAEMTKEYGLDLERSRILHQAYLLRREQIQGTPETLRELADWCAEYALPGERSCRSRAAELEFDELLKEARGDAMALAKLAGRYRVLGLLELSEKTADKARAAAPGNSEVEKLLNPQWQVRVIGANLSSSYSEVLSGSRIVLRPPGKAVAEIAVEFQATRVADEPIDNLLKGLKSELEQTQPDLAPWVETAAPARAADSPCTLFNSRQVVLALESGQTCTPVFSSEPPGMGTTLAGRTAVMMSGFSDIVFSYRRVEGITTIVMRPGEAISLTLVYEVPVGIKHATLRFYDLPDIAVSFR